MTWLAFFFALQVGLAREQIQIMDFTIPIPETEGWIFNPAYIQPWGFYTDAQFGVLAWERLRLSAGIRTYILPVNGFYWMPYRAVYSIDISYDWGWGEIGYGHYCDHHVDSGDPMGEIYADRDDLYLRFKAGPVK